MSKIKFNNGESWQRADNPTVPKMGADYWNEADKQDMYNYAESILAALKETVVVTVESTIDTTGTIVTLEDITAGTSTEYTYQGSPLTLYVDADVEYRITCDASSLGLNVEQSGTYTALAANNRSISFDFRMATVEVNVTGVDSGFEVVVAVDGTEIARQTEAGATYSIRKGASVTITPSSVDGYTAPSAVSLVTEAGGSYSYTLAYEEVKLGIYIEDVNGKLWETDAWDGSVTANGIAVLTEDCRFVMALEVSDEGAVFWGSYGSLIAGVTTAATSGDACSDFSGKSNTVALCEKDANAYAAVAASEYTFPNGNKGYLGGLGEYWELNAEHDRVASALDVLGLYEQVFGYDLFWSSTQCDDEFAWSFNIVDETIGTDWKDSPAYVIPLTTLKSDS